MENVFNKGCDCTGRLEKSGKAEMSSPCVVIQKNDAQKGDGEREEEEKMFNCFPISANTP